MEKSNGVMQDEGSIDFGGVITDEKQTGSVTTVKEVARPDGTNSFGAPSRPPLQYIFTHNGRSIEPDQTPEDANMEEGDEILAVELMDLTESPGNQEWHDKVKPYRETLKKNWSNDPQEAKRTVEEIFDGVVRERLKEVLRLYELRERHFECVIRSKELEVLLSRARAAEQRQLAEGEKTRADKLDEENLHLKKDLDEAQTGHSTFVERLITYCKEPNAERIQRLIASVREELERNAPKTSKNVADGPMGG